MKSVKLFALVPAAICLLVSTPVSGQRANSLAGARESRSTSGRGGTAAGQTAKGSGETAEQQIKTLLPQLKQAILKSDTDFFEKYYADDYIAIHGNGALTTKAQEIENFKS